MSFSLVDPSYLQDEEFETDADFVITESTEAATSSLVSYAFVDENEGKPNLDTPIEIEPPPRIMSPQSLDEDEMSEDELEATPQPVDAPVVPSIDYSVWKNDYPIPPGVEPSRRLTVCCSGFCCSDCVGQNPRINRIKKKWRKYKSRTFQTQTIPQSRYFGRFN